MLSYNLGPPLGKGVGGSKTHDSTETLVLLIFTSLTGSVIFISNPDREGGGGIFKLLNSPQESNTPAYAA